jgi:hypothetical protein
MSPAVDVADYVIASMGSLRIRPVDTYRAYVWMSVASRRRGCIAVGGDPGLAESGGFVSEMLTYISWVQL